MPVRFGEHRVDLLDVDRLDTMIDARWFEMVDDLTRRQLLGAVTVAAGFGIVGCGSDERSGRGDASGTRTIEHEFGTTTVRGKPERVIALGVTDIDPILALGTTPLAAAGYTFSANTSALWPWSEQLVDGADPRFITTPPSEPNFEELAMMSPDLIVAISSGIDQEAYARLSEIAATIARPAGVPAYTATRDQATSMVAAALDQDALGRQRIAQANAAFNAAIEEYPNLRGATGTAILRYQDQYGAFTPGDARGQVLAQLGLVLPPALAALDKGDDFYIELSPEQVDLLEGDVVVVLNANPDGDSGIADLDQLKVAQRGSVIAVDVELRAAMTYNTVLSAPDAVQRLAPMLAKAVG